MFSISKRPTIKEIHKLYQNKQAKPSQVLQFFLNRSKSLDPDLNGVSNYTEELAKSQAKKYDELLDKTTDFENLIREYPLFAIPYFVKSIILVENEILNAGSLILNNFKAPYSSTVYKKIDKAGGLLLGIANMDELACGSSGETCAYGPAKNPIDKTRVPGGSSSGPVVVVSSGQCVFSLGTDTGGSIRLPAAFTDTVGLKPTYGLVSRYGVMPMASSFDQVGPITNNVEDNIQVTKVLAGKDDLDQTSIDSTKMLTALEAWQEKKRQTRTTSQIKKTDKPFVIGLPKEFFVDGIDPKIRAKMEELKTKLSDLGHTLIDVSIPLSKYALSVYYMIMPVELASNLERQDGIRYAFQPNLQDNPEMYFSQREFFGKEIKRRILLGTYASSSGYYDAYYNTAQKVRALAKQDFDKAFEKCDLMLTPTAVEFPFKLNSKTKADPLKMYLTDILTCGINPVRIPALTVPMGLFETSADEENPENGKLVNLPTGCQILGPELSEDKIYKLALEIEQIV
jgi:aspartyl-tRNA(Asn)/glutamyl-tRNA(Gln) amidotransferase subunit A